MMKQKQDKVRIFTQMSFILLLIVTAVESASKGDLDSFVNTRNPTNQSSNPFLGFFEQTRASKPSSPVNLRGL